jgi:tetratricopeptide (TPR) repeat protein
LSSLTHASNANALHLARRVLLIAFGLAIALSACRGAIPEDTDLTKPAETAADSTATPASSYAPDVTRPAAPTDAGQQDDALELLEQGRTLLDDDQCEAALEPLERAVELDPGLADAYLTLGNAYARTAQVEKAIEAYNTAISIDPDFSAAFTNLGAAYLREATDPEALRSAVEAFEKAIALDPEDADTHVNLGFARLQAALLPQAMDEFEQALSLNPELAEAYVGFGFAYLVQGEATQAIDQLQKAAEIDPAMPEARYYLGIAYYETEQFDQAILALEAFLDIEIPPQCKGDQGLAAEAREQAATLLDQLRAMQ